MLYNSLIVFPYIYIKITAIISGTILLIALFTHHCLADIGLLKHIDIT